MPRRPSASASVACVLLFSACKAPLSTIYIHPLLHGAEAECIQDAGKVWVQVTIPHEPSEGQWTAAFKEGTPDGFQATPSDANTRFKWLVPADRITFGGRPGFALTLKNDKNSHDVLVTVRPTYSVVLQGLPPIR